MESTVNKDREWRYETNKGDFLISTAIDKVDLDWLNAAFDTEDMYWAKPLTTERLSIMLSHSLNLGLYRVLPEAPVENNADSPSSPRTPSPTLEDRSIEHLQQVGIARFVTDYITFAYLTDVYIQKDHRSLGLGKWLVKCCQQIMEDVPAMRRGMLLTSPNVGKRFYARELGFYDVCEERDHMICMTRRAYKLNDE